MNIPDGAPPVPPDPQKLRLVELTAPDADADLLLAAHVAVMRAQTPAESCHVMTSADLRASGARVFVGRDAAGQAVAVGALKPMADRAAELKSMHCLHARRGQGLGRALLVALIARARADGIDRLWLETGSDAIFAPARGLYASEGFVPCAPFGAYTADPLSVFMTRAL